MRHKKTYHDMETSRADMTNFRRPAYSVRHPESEYGDTKNMSMAGKLIRAQSEQIRETPAEYVARKYGIGSDADGQEDS